MNFVNDVDFILPLARGNDGLFAQVADIVNAVIGGSVDFDDVKIIIFKLVVEFIDGMGEDASNGSFASTTGANEKIGVTNFVLQQGILKSGSDSRLPNDISEFGGAIFAVEAAHRILERGFNCGPSGILVIGWNDGGNLATFA